MEILGIIILGILIATIAACAIMVLYLFWFVAIPEFTSRMRNKHDRFKD